LLPLHLLRRHTSPDCDLDEAQFAALCEEFYRLAHAIVDVIETAQSRPPRRSRSTPSALLRLVPPGRQEEFEERAAIREADGGMSRAQAERGALRDLGSIARD
jgi:hypothetical protein